MKISSEGQKVQQSQLDLIKQAKYKIYQIDETNKRLMHFASDISNNLNYIISGRDRLLKIWKYKTNVLRLSIKFNSMIECCRFTEDSKLLYVGTYQILYQFYVNNQFKKLCKWKITDGRMYKICCLSSTILLIQSQGSIIKTDVKKKQKILKIQQYYLNGYILDYNKSADMIASVSDKFSIKLWKGNDGSLIIEKLTAHKEYITQVLFIVNNNQLISLDLLDNLVIWNINYDQKQLQYSKLIENSGRNISLVLKQQYLLAIGRKLIKLYKIDGEFVRQFNHTNKFVVITNTIQNDQMKAVLIQGEQKLLVFKLEMDLQE